MGNYNLILTTSTSISSSWKLKVINKRWINLFSFRIVGMQIQHFPIRFSIDSHIFSAIAADSLYIEEIENLKYFWDTTFSSRQSEQNKFPITRGLLRCVSLALEAGLTVTVLSALLSVLLLGSDTPARKWILTTFMITVKSNSQYCKY